MVLVSNRQMIWESVVNVAYDNNLLIGSGMLSQIMPILDCDQFPAILNSFSSCNFQHPHNLFVSSLFRGGIIGLALLVLLFLLGISSALESDKDERWLVFAMLSYCAIIFLFDGDQLVAKLDFVWLIFWLPVALAVYLDTRETEEGF
jgi:O-antigen ligase